MNDHLDDKAWPSLRWRLRKDREGSGLLQRLQASGIKPPPLDLTWVDRMIADARPRRQAAPQAARDAPTKRKPAPHDPHALLTMAQAAARLNITPEHLSALIGDGALRYIDISRGEKRAR